MPQNLRNNLVTSVNQAIHEVLDNTFSEVQARDLGLYTGMEHPSANSPFWDRLKTAPDQKHNLGKYMCRMASEGSIPSLAWNPADNEDARDSLNTIFFECGSTICPIIGQFATILADPIKAKGIVRPRTVLTNNMFAMTALVNLVDHVVPVEGSFRTQYFGFFPFAERANAPKHTNSNHSRLLWNEETSAYAKLRSEIGKCNVVIATCSNFSFLAGPLVGTRANAITKHAMYLGKNRQHEFILQFHFEKIIPLHQAKSGMQDPQDSCYCILPPPHDALAKLKGGSFNEWHDKWMNNKHHVIAKELSVGTTKIANPDWLPVPLSETDFVRSWFDCFEGVRIIISLPEDDLDGSRLWLTKEIERVNQQTRKFGMYYVINDSSESFVSTHRVVEVEMKAGNQTSKKE